MHIMKSSIPYYQSNIRLKALLTASSSRAGAVLEGKQLFIVIKNPSPEDFIKKAPSTEVAIAAIALHLLSIF